MESTSTTLLLLSLLPFVDSDLEPSNNNSLPLSHFDLFALLLPELRAMIWQETLPSRRNLPFPLFSPTTTTTSLLGQGEIAGTLPVALSVCFASRSIAQRAYKAIAPVNLPLQINMCIAPTKDLLHLPYALLGQPSFLSSLNTLHLTNPTFLASIQYLEIRSFHWGATTSPRWRAFLRLAEHLTSLRELYLDFWSRFEGRGDMGLRWQADLEPARKQLKGLKNWFVERKKEGGGTRSVPEVVLHRGRRRMVRSLEEDRTVGEFELPVVWNR